MRTMLSPGVNFRDAELVKDGNDSFALLIAQSKNIYITHQGRDLQLSRGDATLLHVCATGSVGSPEEFGYISALIPYAELVARVAVSTKQSRDEYRWYGQRCLPVQSRHAPGAPGQPQVRTIFREVFAFSYH